MKKETKTKPAADTSWSEMVTRFATLNPMANNVGMAGWLEVMTESARFASDRFQKDLDTQHALLQCKKVEDILRIQSEFYRNALEQYTFEASRMSELISKATVQAMDGITTSRARSYDDIPL